MKILWLKSDLLVPLDKGGKLRTWHLLRHLAQRHDITYVAFATPAEKANAAEAMAEVAGRIECIPRSDAPKRSLGFYLGVARHLMARLPYAVGKYRSRPFERRVQALLDEHAFDLLVCDFVLPAVNLPARLPCPLVIFTHNVEAEIWRRHADTHPGPLARLLYTAQYRRMLRFEGRALARATGVLAVSDTDRETLTRLYPAAARAPIHVVPTGVDSEFFHFAPSPTASRSLVFTGSMDWLPNEDAMVWFCRDILPLVRTAEPETTLTIVGRTPTARVAQLAELPGVTVTGRVDDVRPFMADAAVYVVPLRIGGGTRLKIFEAMAMGKAVVSTAIGAEGLPVRDGEHVRIDDSPRAFAATVIQLMRDLDQRRALERAARALVEERYDWSEVSRELERALFEVAGRSSEQVLHVAHSPA
jgi:sugar transferase (PEP-CTERM/EpsH1 system associated)